MGRFAFFLVLFGCVGWVCRLGVGCWGDLVFMVVGVRLFGFRFCRCIVNSVGICFSFFVCFYMCFAYSCSWLFVLLCLCGFGSCLWCLLVYG